MLFLKSDNIFEKLEKDPFSFPQIFLRELDGTMTLSETIQLEQGKVLIYQKNAEQSDDSYAFVVCWDKRLDWKTFQGLYELYEERASQYTGGSTKQFEPVLIAKSIDNDVLRFIQEHTTSSQLGNPPRTFTH